MSYKFDKAVNDLLLDEGGYVNHPNDPGGETKYGISKRSYPGVDIRNLTPEMARRIYYEDWWVPLGLENFPDPLGAKMLNVSVNVGVRTGWKILQRALNSFPLPERLSVDGVYGRKTKRALDYVLQRFSSQQVTNKVAEYQVARYEWLARTYRKFRVFINGWRRRARRYVR